MRTTTYDARRANYGRSDLPDNAMKRAIRPFSSNPPSLEVSAAVRLHFTWEDRRADERSAAQMKITSIHLAHSTASRRGASRVASDAHGTLVIQAHLRDLVGGSFLRDPADQHCPLVVHLPSSHLTLWMNKTASSVESLSSHSFVHTGALRPHFEPSASTQVASRSRAAVDERESHWIHHKPHKEVRAVRTRLVVQAKRREVLAEWLVARTTEQRELSREPQSMVRAELEVTLAAVEPPVAARRLERKLVAASSTGTHVNGGFEYQYLDIGDMFAHASDLG
ncbi:hypothetical protein FI667_g10528, partial [Globisporangium splendens]